MSGSPSPAHTRSRPSSPLAVRTNNRQTTTSPSSNSTTTTITTATMAHPVHRTHPPRSSLSAARAASLQLPSLPRFHPANFPSQGSSNSSFATTPSSGGNSPAAPVSPRSQQRQYSEAQRQLYAYQRELLATSGRLPGRASTAKPISPRLLPAGSPGPVTPLELEDAANGYLTAAGAVGGATDQAQREYVDKLIREEAARRGELSPKRATVGSY